MEGNSYTLKDFRIGERVVHTDVPELSMVIADIDNMHGKIICRIPKYAEPLKHRFTPGELEKITSTGRANFEKQR